MLKRIIVCGGRTYGDRETVEAVLWDVYCEKCGGVTPTIVHGGAIGADSLAGDVAAGFGFEVEIHPANWKRWRKAAGPIRNRHMADLGADLCIAFPGGAGTRDMVRQAIEHGIPVVRIDA